MPTSSKRLAAAARTFDSLCDKALHERLASDESDDDYLVINLSTALPPTGTVRGDYEVVAVVRGGLPVRVSAFAVTCGELGVVPPQPGFMSFFSLYLSHQPYQTIRTKHASYFSDVHNH